MARTALFERTTGQEPSSQQAFRLPPFWNGLQIRARKNSAAFDWSFPPEPGDYSPASGTSKRRAQRTNTLHCITLLEQRFSIEHKYVNNDKQAEGAPSSSYDLWVRVSLRHLLHRELECLSLLSSTGCFFPCLRQKRRTGGRLFVSLTGRKNAAILRFRSAD